MYRIVWEYDAKPEQLEQFENVYGPEGLWVKFFRKSADFLGTELFRCTNNPYRFVTLDEWRSRATYENFRKTYAAEYAQLDEFCERITLHERTLGVTDDGKE